MEVEHDLIAVDEFDALAIELKGVGPCNPSEDIDISRSSSSSPDTYLKSTSEGSKSAAPKLGRYPAKEHAEKVAKELGAEHGLIYLPGQQSELWEDSDQGPPFRQRRYFFYLSGADFANCTVTYDIASAQLILWIPYTDPREALWFGTTPSIAECKAQSDVDDVRFSWKLPKYLQRYVQHPTPRRAGTPAATLFVLRADQAPDAAATRPAVYVDTARLRPAMDAARVIKSAHEVALIRRANALSSAAHRAVLTYLKRMSNERDVEVLFRGFCLSHGARRQAYPVIAGAGSNAAALHYGANDQPLAGKQLLVLDAGCEWDCYASDVTRTLPLGGTLSPEATDIVALVTKMQDECIARIKPGYVFYKLHLHACEVAAQGLLALGVLRGAEAKELVERGVVAAFFPHGLGHHVGLEVHDVSGRERLMLGAGVAPRERRGGGALPPPTGAAGKREWVSPEMLAHMCRDAVTAPPPYKGRQKLVKNMIVTIEPGIYFSRDYIEAFFLGDSPHAKYIDTDVLEKYYPVGGVRIEDDILVTDDGYENLTTAPKGEEALKIINGEK